MKSETTRNAIRLLRSGNGWAAEGPGYYVWDEDPNEVARAARELLRGNHGVRPTRRMLVVHTDATIDRLAGGSSEALDF